MDVTNLEIQQLAILEISLAGTCTWVIAGSRRSTQPDIDLYKITCSGDILLAGSKTTIGGHHSWILLLLYHFITNSINYFDQTHVNQVLHHIYS
jgi:lysylphosphatidylglycerol synthetase-like protein (DUF2156 family)